MAKGPGHGARPRSFERGSWPGYPLGMCLTGHAAGSETKHAQIRLNRSKIRVRLKGWPSLQTEIQPSWLSPHSLDQSRASHWAPVATSWFPGPTTCVGQALGQSDYHSSAEGFFFGIAN